MGADVNRLIQQVRSENAKWQSRHRLYLCILTAAIIGWLVFTVVTFRSHAPLSPLAHGGFLIFIALCGQEGIGLLSRPMTHHRAAILALTQSGETVIVGPLLESKHPAWIAGGHIFRSDTTLYFAVVEALTRLLPKLTEAEYRTLAIVEKKALYTMLICEHREVALPAMEAVTRFHDAGAAPTLEKVAHRAAKTPTALSLREAAKSSLQRIQQDVRA